VRSRKRDDRSIKNGSFHSSTHHGVRKKGRNPTVTILSCGIAEVFSEGIPIDTIICLEEAKIRE